MAKTQEELQQLKIEYEALNCKLKELTEEELKQVSGGITVADYYENMHKNEPYIKLILFGGYPFGIGFSITRISDNVVFDHVGFSNGVGEYGDYTDYYFIGKYDPNLKLSIHASNSGDGKFYTSEYK